MPNLIETDELAEETILEITEEDHRDFRRLDQLLASSLPISRTLIKKLFDQGDIYSDNTFIKLELKKIPAPRTKIFVVIPPPPPTDAEPENIYLDILFEDEHLIFVNKPAGLVTHPAPGNYTGTLVNAILWHCPDLKQVGSTKRPGIVHRLDKGTSGVMVIAKTQRAHEGLSLLFANHNIDRVYECLVVGKPPFIQGTLNSTIGRHPTDRLKMAVNVKNGKNAITHFKFIEDLGLLTHLECTLETGRTHQIRVHLSALTKTPILGDPLYAQPNEQLKRLGQVFSSAWDNYPYPLLHAKVLGLVHPITNQTLRFNVDRPHQFQKILTLAQGLKSGRIIS